MTKEIIVYSIGNALSKGCLLLSFPIYAKVIDSTEFGLQDITVATAMLLTLFLSFGLDSGFAREFNETPDSKRENLLTTIYIIYAILGSMLFCIVCPFSERLSQWLFNIKIESKWIIATSALAVTHLYKNILMLNKV